uniref:Uncharacterized protein n=1 Tax=uncultured marine virus TaxID=186617 RepID=A0A0F7L722_9VIRU|nr:hypothetical protein [uncultured marine virus]
MVATRALKSYPQNPIGQKMFDIILTVLWGITRGLLIFAGTFGAIYLMGSFAIKIGGNKTDATPVRYSRTITTNKGAIGKNLYKAERG